jgi:hypothetical protein
VTRTIFSSTPTRHQLPVEILKSRSSTYKNIASLQGRSCLLVERPTWQKPTFLRLDRGGKVEKKRILLYDWSECLIGPQILPIFILHLRHPLSSLLIYSRRWLIMRQILDWAAFVQQVGKFDVSMVALCLHHCYKCNLCSTSWSPKDGD